MLQCTFHRIRQIKTIKNAHNIRVMSNYEIAPKKLRQINGQTFQTSAGWPLRHTR